ncbi:unnamed protein product [Ambrosiozyma monospora]|uniref:Unnamed protein product n=1 Tax=Ambrosiozyma monospora TaxID=43982 RepID=A0ACB5SW11_AMBMO|nr:unnamed protein product [Ambrosiozyma monospora]
MSDKNLYSNRNKPISTSILHNTRLMESLFKPTSIFEGFPLLTYENYIQTIQQRVREFKPYYNNIHKNTPYTVFSEGQDPPNNRLLLTNNFKFLNSRFKKQNEETQLEDSLFPDILSFFSNNFSKRTAPANQATTTQFLHTFFPPTDCITEEELTSLSNSFTEGELEDALNSLCAKGYSSPRADDLSYEAWKASWVDSGTYLTFLANHLLSNEASTIENSPVSQILIKLLPKKSFDQDHPNPSNLRPISLCNTSMRIINYAMTIRLMPIINRLISPAQQAFLLQGSIHRNTGFPKTLHQFHLFTIVSMFGSLAERLHVGYCLLQVASHLFECWTNTI